MLNLAEKPFYLSQDQITEIEKTVAGLTLEEKIRQMFIILADAYQPEALETVVEKGIGGVLFRPARPAAEIRARYAELEAKSKLPLLHAANLEEGGAGGSCDGTYFGSQLQIAAANNREDVKHFAENCAYEGMAAGYNWTFSPVSDIDMNFRNPITNCRTLGADPKRVADFAEIYVKRIQELGIGACAKHFPGDGVDYRDQHLHPSYNSLSAEEWRATYGMIYRRLIDAGLLSVMCGHICQPAMEMEHTPGLKPEDCMPATLSRGLLTGVLREELGFNGLISTDATIMGGFTMAMPREKAIPTVFASGCDMIVFNTDVEEDISYALKGVETGVLTEERVNEAVTRVLALKAKVCNAKPVPVYADADKDQAACADHAVTLVKNNAAFLPLTTAKYPKVRLCVVGHDKCRDGSLMDMMASELESRGFSVEKYDPMADDLHGTSTLPQDRVTVTMLNYPPASNQTTVRVEWCKKHAMEIPRFVNEEAHVFVSFANPYHLQDVPRAKVFINAYTATQATVRAVAEKLCGESAFTGVNPVDPFCGLPDTRY